MHTYKYPPGFISENQAIEVIYQCIYLDSSKSEAFKLIRQRIRQAQQNGDLPKFAQSKVSPSIFFAWALKSKGWNSLVKINGLPISAVVNLSGVSAHGVLGDAYVITDPEADSTQIQIENQDLQKKLTLKEAELIQTKLELEVMNTKNRLHREKMSRAGKKGGRGKSL
jgi:hypothetical protein